jgi:anti-sigma factor RsiW
MECKDLQELLQRYVDDELPPAIRQAAGSHIDGCAECQRTADKERAWQKAIRQAGAYYTAPDALRRQVIHMARQRAPQSGSGMRAWAVAASLLLAIGLSSGVTSYIMRPPVEESLTGQMIDAHVRSLLAEHLTDVASSDQHTVKPWFHGRLDYAPPVQDLAAQGFPLIGGRLDYLDRHDVAALVYRHAQHPINLFVMPTGEADGIHSATTQNGYNVLRWTQHGFAYWAVSDLNATELHDFQALIERGG